MRELMSVEKARAKGCPKGVCERASREGKKVLRIEWDEADGFAPHSWGYVQWSIRPYEQGFGCDGTTDDNIHFIGEYLCRQIGLDYLGLAHIAYGEDSFQTPLFPETGEQTLLPDRVDNKTLMLLLHDLGQINNRSLVEVLEEELDAAGYEIDDWAWVERYCAPALHDLRQ